MGYLNTDEARARQLLNHLLDSGINVLDTAHCYPGAEEMIGRCVGGRRDEFVLITKCGHNGEGVTAPEWSPAAIAQSAECSLRRLRTDHLDVLLLHSCELRVLEAGDAIAALVRAKQDGKTRFIGYSGDNEAAAYAAQHPELDVIEISVSICDQHNLEVALPVAQSRNLGVLAKRPIANAAWKPSRQQHGLYVSYAQPYRERLKKMQIAPGDLGFTHNGNAWPDIALRFTLAQPGVHTAIVGTTNPRNLDQNLRAVAAEPLPEETLSRLRTAFRAAEQRAGETWLGLT